MAALAVYAITARRFSSARLQPSSGAGMASVRAKRRITASRLAHLDWSQPQAQSKLAVEMSPPTGKRRLRWRSPHARESERSSSLWLAASQLLAPAIRHRRASLLQSDQCPTTRHKAAINRKRSTAAQYVYNTKPSSSPQQQLQPRGSNHAQVRVT